MSRYQKTVPWVDKYRPKKLRDVVYQTEVISMLNRVVVNGNLPHLLLYGQAGTGKTSSVLAIAMELFGPRIFRERILELNASDERGINVVRTKIIDFAKISIGETDPKYPCPPYKIIILDEADAMTTEAQSALRKTIEDYSNITRFCFICNYINQIIEPIASRCVKIRFKPINSEFMTTKLCSIAHNEKLDIDDGAMGLISKISNGDLRKGIMFLQNLQYLRKKITIEDIHRIANCIPETYVDDIWNQSQTLSKISAITQLAYNVCADGYAIGQFIECLNQRVIDSSLDDIQKARICLAISNAEKNLIDGADEYLQLTNVLVIIQNVCQKN